MLWAISFLWVLYTQRKNSLFSRAEQKMRVIHTARCETNMPLFSTRIQDTLIPFHTIHKKNVSFSSHYFLLNNQRRPKKNGNFLPLTKILFSLLLSFQLMHRHHRQTMQYDTDNEIPLTTKHFT